jgi:hypothetical protein
MKKTTKTTVAAAVAVVLSGGVAAAATGNLPTQAEQGISTANDHAVVEVPAVSDDQSTASSDTESESVSSDQGSQPDNHGAVVSEVAHTTEATGADKGAAVSAAARDNTGQNDHAADQATNGPSNDEAP